MSTSKGPVTRNERKAKSEGGKTGSAASGAALITRKENSCLQPVGQAVNLSVKMDPEARNRKNAKMKVDSDELLKTKGE